MNEDWMGVAGALPAIEPPLDPGFRPAALFNRRLRELIRQGNRSPMRFGLEKPDGSVSVYDTMVASPSSRLAPASLYYAERILKFLLWQKGGWKVYVGGPVEVGVYLQEQYCEGGTRRFDFRYMSDLYERPFTVSICRPEEVPDARERELALGRHLDGCRVGFDLGASDRKASAVIDG
ncbi:MAG: ROK family protein, partial [Acidobacteria bacterium]|nr:ROK family protein [Acidobacteriota bacterium]